MLKMTILAVFLAACSGGSGGETDGPDGGPVDTTDAAPPIDQPPLEEGLATLAGTSIPGAQDGDRDNAYLDNPVNVEFADGHIFIADFYNSSIRRATPQGTVETVSSQPETGLFVRPFGMTALGSYLYIGTDAKSNGREGGAIWRMPIAGGAPQLLLDGVGRPRGLATLDDGRLAVADYQAHTVSIFDPADNSLNILAGQDGVSGYAEGSGTAALFNTPYDVAVYQDLILVSDFGNHRIRQITLGGDVSTFAGTGVIGNISGARENSTYNFPQGLAVDSSERIYITDTGNYTVRIITSDVDSVIAGSAAGYQDSTDPLAGKLFGLEGITVSGDYAYIADGNRGEDGPYHRVRRLTLP